MQPSERVIRSIAGVALLVLLVLAASDGRAQPAVRGMGICYTAFGWCPLPYPERTPLGAACYCIMPGNRYVYGVTRNDYYYGNVNPYFNPHLESQTVPRDIK
jgi:hypothetical protein